MPKKGKVGKQRKDKFYKLAKETGYRSRASFKLIQLNRKHEFLPKARVLIDLCAAPGGWLQVAQQAMPVSSVIIGVDLVPIRTLPNVITMQEDITTNKCLQSIKKQLNTWKADVVLHDGAPNLGQNWIQDAFSQNELTLSALKLASQVLTKGGWFVTKVFRSKDYLSLVWVFKKLFKQVHVTKPAASRNESAEIFVVCQGFLAPHRIDDSFLDPGKVFKDVKNKNESKKNIIDIIGKKPKAEGYDEEAAANAILKASEFIFCDNHMERLGDCTQIIMDDDDIKDHKLTTDEIKQCASDIKVLGKADLKLLLNWRKLMREIIHGTDKNEDDSKEEAVKVEDAEENELEKVLKQADNLELSKLQDAKRKKKKILKERKKLHEKMNLKMIIKDDEPVVDEDLELFKLSQIKNKKDLINIEDETNLEFELEPTLMSLDDDLQPVYKKNFAPYDRNLKKEATARDDPQKSDSEDSDDVLSSDLEFESESENEQELEEKTEAILEGKKNPLMVDLVERPDIVKDTVSRWFDREEFADAEMDSDLELDLIAEEADAASMDVGKPDRKGTGGFADQRTDSEKESAEAKRQAKLAKEAKKKLKRSRLDAEGMALGSLLIQSKKIKRDMIDDGYNRYASNDTNLPAWFVEDEKIFNVKPIPVTREQVEEYKVRLRDINVRTVKKVVEAKARKKKRALRRMERAKKRAEKVTDHPDMSAQEKAQQLKTIYKKAVVKEERKLTYVVAKSGTASKRGIRPAGVKGRFKVVDSRMKKDARKQKAQLKAQRQGKTKSKKKAQPQKKPRPQRKKR